MKNFFRIYKESAYERRTLMLAIPSLCFSSVLAVSKFVIGVLFDPALCGIAAYTIALLFAKLRCVLGIARDDKELEKGRIVVAVAMLFSSFLYIVFTGSVFFTERTAESHGLIYVTLLAFVSFGELIASIVGIFRIRKGGRHYGNIKLINFCMSLIAILTTQVAILDYTATEGTDVYNAFSAICIGAFIALCAVYIIIAPRISVHGKEHNEFVFVGDGVSAASFPPEIMLCRSRIYGSYVYRGKADGNIVRGDIERTATLWKRMNVVCRIIWCLLFEIIFFVWMAGRIIFFFRTFFLPERLERKMKELGFARLSSPSASGSGSDESDRYPNSLID